MKSADPENQSPPCRERAVLGLVQEIADEHAAIHEVIRRIERELDRLLEHPGKLGEAWELPDLARQYAESLQRHFELEESGGFLGNDELRGDPSTRGTVEELIAEHRDFERRIGRIIEELDTGFVPSHSVQSCFDGELRSLITDMAVHESREAELLRKLAAAESDRASD